MAVTPTHNVSNSMREKQKKNHHIDFLLWGITTIMVFHTPYTDHSNASDVIHTHRACLRLKTTATRASTTFKKKIHRHLALYSFGRYGGSFCCYLAKFI